MKPKIVILTGAGISAESGINTFRDSDGLWEGYNVYDVATPEAWQRNPEMVQEFYNMRRKAVLEAKPNEAHLSLVKLEQKYDIVIITQNVDDLHERAGSAEVLHLHGVITKSQSSFNPKLTYEINGWELRMGENCERGSQLRPHVVWFGEAVPMIEKAAEVCGSADIFIIIGTSLQVYPAAGLVEFVPAGSEKILIDPKAHELNTAGVRVIPEKATVGVPKLVKDLLRR